MEQKYMDVQIWLYDIWGNKKEGYEVNNQWKHDSPLTMDEETWTTDKLLKKVIKKYLLKPTVRLSNITFMTKGEDYVEFEIGGIPCGRLEVVKRYGIKEGVKMKFEVQHYDTWGNDKDGWIVNDSFTIHEAEIQEVEEEEVIKYCLKEFFPTNVVTEENFEVDNRTIYVNQPNGAPFGQITIFKERR